MFPLQFHRHYCCFKICTTTQLQLQQPAVVVVLQRNYCYHQQNSIADNTTGVFPKRYNSNHNYNNNRYTIPIFHHHQQHPCQFYIYNNLKSQKMSSASLSTTTTTSETPTMAASSSMESQQQKQQGPIEKTMEMKLKTTFQPHYLQIINESHKHNVPVNSETHFKVVVVSDLFITTKSLLQRHRLIHDTLKDELNTEGKKKIHALSIVAKTVEQWKQLTKDGISPLKIESSPNCMGGDGSLPKRHS